ncbi:MAG: hypothetical protein H0U98_16445 [Alphaproteobacteria bacterium]|nr:hypothetical protein [Alphaproteobacteria bacterium]
MKSRILFALTCLLPPVAFAQPSQGTPTENIIVTAPRAVPEQAAHDFVKSFTGVSPASGKIARWRMGVCPVVTGLPPSGLTLVRERVRQVAGQVGAPVGAQSCKPNIDIVFTLNPQVLLDEVRKKTPVLLGFHDVAQQERLATVTHPVQAWYTTQTVDLNFNRYVDDKLRNHGGFYIVGSDGPKYGSVFVPDARVVQASGSRIADGLSSELYHVVIVINVTKVNGLTVGALTDYAAMLELAQTQSFESCAPMATITNLVSPGCDAAVKTDALSASDLAYLQGLYSIDPRASLVHQKAEIADRMQKGRETN